ncbi:MAG: GumC family protein [Mesorhizobium sp.]
MNQDHDPNPYGTQQRNGWDAVSAYLLVDLPRLFFWLRKGVRWIVLAMVVGLLAGVSYSMLSKPRYTVTTDILMNPAGLQIVSDDLFRQNDQQRDAQLLNVESKRQTLVSRSVLLRAIAALDLENDPEFVPPPSAFSIGRLLGRSGPSQSNEVIALGNLMKRLSARRDELSFVVTLSVWTNNADKSIRISEAIIKAFREELVSADSEGASRTVDALTDRIGKLKADVNAAEEAVEAFRRENGLQAIQGELVSSRSMSQINQQLVEARQKLIAAQSRYRELSSGNADAVAMQSPTVSALRTQYATLKSQADAQSMIYGPRHPRASSQQIELRALQQEIDAETKRIVLAAKNDLDQAQSNASSLEAEAARAGSGVFSDNDAQVRLRELTREAAAKTAIYEAFLVRAREVTERQQLDTTNIRIISPPVEPRSRSWPPPTMQLGAFGALVGMVLGVLGVLGRGIAIDMKGPRRPPTRPMDSARRSPAQARLHELLRTSPSPAAVRAPAHARSLLDPWYASAQEPAASQRHDPRTYRAAPAYRR